MATQVGVGNSIETDSREAGREAAARAVAAGGSAAGAVQSALLFATAPHDQERLLAGVRSVLPAAQLGGCSGEGVIVPGDTHECDHAVAVMTFASDAIRLEPRLLRNYSADPAARGQALARELGARDDVIAVLLFPDGLTGNCSALLDHLHAHLSRPVLIVGGTSADAMVLQRTYQYGEGQAVSDAISAVIVRGRGRMEFAVSHGCMPIGLERTVTRGENGWVHEIDGLPAWDVFKEYLEGDPEDLSAEGVIHLCLGKPLDAPLAREYDAPHVIHTPLQLDKTNGALFFPGGGLATGQRIRLTRRDPTRIRESAIRCAQKLSALGRTPTAVFQFDCAGRGRVLFGSRAADEIVRPLQATLGRQVPWIGFHSYGEIAPIGGRPYYHNYTVALCALYADG